MAGSLGCPIMRTHGSMHHLRCTDGENSVHRCSGRKELKLVLVQKACFTSFSLRVANFAARSQEERFRSRLATWQRHELAVEPRPETAVQETHISSLKCVWPLHNSKPISATHAKSNTEKTRTLLHTRLPIMHALHKFVRNLQHSESRGTLVAVYSEASVSLVPTTFCGILGPKLTAER